jgi:alpha/beta superfamily hydrolase
MYTDRGDVVEAGVRATARWADAATWTGDGMRREVFFFRSRGERLYGSLFVAEEPSRPLGVVACNSWGVEADRCDPLLRSVAIEAARHGGASLVFHYPGYGDSFGDLPGVGLADLSEAAGDAVAEASRRCPGFSWILAGFMFGASVACLAQRQAGVELLLLVQPALRPGAYFQRLAKRTQPLALPSRTATESIEAGAGANMAYGYPIPRSIAASGPEDDAAVAAALAAFEGEGAVVRHAKPEQALAVPQRFQQIEVPGAWRFGSLKNLELARAATSWLDRRSGDGAR